jgi:hypothetical protein
MIISKIVLLLVAVVALVSCNAFTPLHYTTRSLTFDTKSLESGLRRGTSTMADVERLLGKPDGAGAMLLPADSIPRITWIYEKIELEAYKGQATVMQDVALVFFKEGVFDGFMWFSDAPDNRH